MLIALLALAVTVGVAAGLITQSVLTGVAVGATGFLVVCTIGAYTDGWAWTGIGPSTRQKRGDEDFVPGKTLWDLVQVAIIPAVLVFGVWWLNERQTTADKISAKRQATVTAINANKQATATAINAQNQARDTVLDTYLDRMSDLMKQGLSGTGRKKLPGWLQQVARARTITALRRLDGTRNALLTQFLLDKAGRFTLIDLSSALHAARLPAADLTFADLRGADLRGAGVQEVVWNDTTCPDSTNSDTNGTSPHSCAGHLGHL